jgi:hypothetical protein
MQWPFRKRYHKNNGSILRRERLALIMAWFLNKVLMWSGAVPLVASVIRDAIWSYLVNLIRRYNFCLRMTNVVFGFLVAICVFSNFSKIFLLGKKAREALNKVSGCKIRVMLPWVPEKYLEESKVFFNLSR